MPSKKKVLIINPRIPEYRVPIFNLLGAQYDLSILHSGKEVLGGQNKFKQILVSLKKMGPFYLLKTNIHKICKNYDVVISEASLRYPDRILLAFNKIRKYKWIYWGIGVSASYNKRFDQDKKYDFIRNFIFKHADCNIFYTDYPIPKYVAAGFDKASLFVANNTTAVSYNEDVEYKKDSLLFIGTLYKQKKIYELLEAYKAASKKLKQNLLLNIVGDGDEYGNIQQWIKDNGFEGTINLVGPLFDQEKLEPYFRKAFVCISPGQAGLSVLTSMGCGTPFVTRKDAITGGEIFNIENNKNGVIYETDSELEDIIVDISQNGFRYIDMGIKARQYYISNRLPDQMVSGFVDAIEYSLRQK